ncbi:MAG TPA: SDR family oxidoreductase [Nevskiaceae bacterium]|nr:SDR family oxidoreductase [Nevskiaceae bacterium]
MIVVTGASGQLGRLVIQNLLQTLPAERIVAAVRSPEKVADLAALGVQVRKADYDQPATLKSAFAGASRVLLISSNAVGVRVAQHKAVIAAAENAGVELLAYTSLLRADSSPLALASEHVLTEAVIRASGLRYAMLRNGWYTEIYAMGIPMALKHGALIGCAGEGRIASAARADYASAAAAVLVGDASGNQVCELAGDDSYTLAELAAETSRQSGKLVSYVNMTEAGLKTALIKAGVPANHAEVRANSDSGAAIGGLFDDSHQLSTLIGRATTPMKQTVADVLAG